MVNYVLVIYPRRSPTSQLDSNADHGQNREGLHVFRTCSAKCVCNPQADTVQLLTSLPSYTCSTQAWKQSVSFLIYHNIQVFVYSALTFNHKRLLESVEQIHKRTIHKASHFKYFTALSLINSFTELYIGFQPGLCIMVTDPPI